MTPIKATTSKGTYLFVPVPEGSGEDSSINRRQDDFNQHYLQYNHDKHKGYWNYNSIDLPKGCTYSIIGLLSQLPEDQAEGMCNRLLGESYKEAILRLMKANGAYTVNPYGTRVPKNMNEWGQAAQPEHIYQEEVDMWQAAEQTTSKEWLIIKVK